MFEPVSIKILDPISSYVIIRLLSLSVSHSYSPCVYGVCKRGEKKSCVRYLWTGVELIKFARSDCEEARIETSPKGLRIPKASVNYLPAAIVFRFSCAAQP